MQVKPINLSLVVQGLARMLERLLSKRFQLLLDCPPNLPPVRAEESNLEQALINFALNARDAMPDGGEIRISTRLVVLDDAVARLNLDARPGRFVCLAVSDTGCRLVPGTFSHIFDPFYTTGDASKGTGLVLSTVHGKVQKDRGWVEVCSQIGQGASLKVFLPVCDTAPGVTLPSEIPLGATACRGSGEAVLIVEYENTVRETARLALERAGYRVFEADDGPDALAAWQRCPVRIDLLLIDRVMPRGVNGAGLARILQARDARLRILYTSDYGSGPIRADSRLIPGVNFLPKPYGLALLLSVVRRCLDGQSPLQEPALLPLQRTEKPVAPDSCNTDAGSAERTFA